MRTVMSTIFGAIAGLVVGAAAGMLTGIAWVNIFRVSDFEGYSGMLVFFTFAPAGAVVGGLAGAIWAGLAASRSRIRIETNS